MLKSLCTFSFTNHPILNMISDLGLIDQAEDDGMKAMSSCATSKDALLASAKTLTANSAGLDSAKTKARSMTKALIMLTQKVYIRNMFRDFTQSKLMARAMMTIKSKGSLKMMRLTGGQSGQLFQHESSGCKLFRDHHHRHRDQNHRCCKPRKLYGEHNCYVFLF